MEGNITRKKTEEELKEQMYFNQWINFMAEMIIKYADKMQPIIEEEDAKLRKQGSSLKKEWEKIERRYYATVGKQEPER